MYNNNSNYILSQQQIQKYDQDIDCLTGSEVKVHDHLLGMANITNRIFISQTYLAHKLGLCRATINRALKKLSALGLIQKIDRGWKEDRTRVKKTCYYIVSRIFDMPEIRKRYSHKFKSLVYMKLINNFEQLIESGYKHCINFVTGIKSSLYSCFKNKEEGLRRSLGKENIVTLDYREGRDSVKKYANEEGSVMTEFIASLGGFNEEAKKYLSAYDDEVVKEAIRALGKKVPSGNAWAYFLSILNRIASEKDMKPDLGVINSVNNLPGKPQLTVPITSSLLVASAPPKTFFAKKEEKKEVLSTHQRMLIDKAREEKEAGQKVVDIKPTTIELANKISKVKEMAEGNPFMMEVMNDVIKGLLNMEYRLTGEPNEEIALYYLEKKRREVDPKGEKTMNSPEPERSPLSEPTALGNLLNQVMPEMPVNTEVEVVNNFAPLPERIKLRDEYKKKLGMIQEPSKVDDYLPGGTVAKASVSPETIEKVYLVKQHFPGMVVEEVISENEPECPPSNDNDYEEVY